MAQPRRTNRRSFLRLAGLALTAPSLTTPAWSAIRGPQSGGPPPPRFVAVEHVEFYVSNAKTSRDFYTRVFGRTLLIRGNKRYLKVGASYLGFEPATGSAVAGQVDRISVATRLDLPALHEELERRGVRYQDDPGGRYTAVFDPDGSRLQLSPKDWSFLPPPEFSPEVVQATGPPIFEAGVSRVTIRCSDIAKAREFYGKVFGKEGPDILLVRTEPGEPPGVSEIAFLVAALKVADVARELTSIGAKIIASLQSGFGNSYVRFSDPDGLRLFVHDSDG